MAERDELRAQFVRGSVRSFEGANSSMSLKDQHNCATHTISALEICELYRGYRGIEGIDGIESEHTHVTLEHWFGSATRQGFSPCSSKIHLLRDKNYRDENSHVLRTRRDFPSAGPTAQFGIQ